jgi:hypothetical protein
MSEQKSEKSGAKPSATKAVSASKAAAAEKKPASRETQSDRSARDTDPKAPKPTEEQASVKAGRFASRRVWPD